MPGYRHDSVQPVEKKAGVDKVRYMNNINEPWPSAGQERCNPGLHNIMTPLNAKNIVSLVPDDPRDLEKGSDPAQPRFLKRIDLDRHVLEHRRERGIGTTYDPDENTLL